MKKRALGVAAAALGLLVAVAGASAGTRSHATELQLTASLTSAEEVPPPTGNVSAARGTFTATVTKSAAGGVVAWQLTSSGLSGQAVAAHVHTAPRGQPGPVTVPLCGPCESNASGTANVSATVLAALQSGGMYANVHTRANGAGEIRGQVAVSASLRGVLNARQEVPKPKGTVARAQANFTGTLTKSGTTGRLAWRLTFARLTGRAVAAHIHVARRGRPGPVALALCGPCRNGARGTANASASLLSALEAGRAYVNVHTRLNPGGEVRGQLPATPLVISTS